MALLKLSSPWIIFYREMQKMFEHDQNTHIVFDEDENLIRVYVENDIRKANALKKILLEEKTFGNVTIKIKVVGPSNEEPKYLKKYSADNMTDDEAFHNALRANDAFHWVKSVEGIFSNPIVYVVFDKSVVQYFNDNLTDAHGCCTTLYQEIAKDIFKPMEGVYYCTDTYSNDNRENPFESTPGNCWP